MYKSLPGLKDAFQSIAIANTSLQGERKRKSWRLNHSFEDIIDETPQTIEKVLKNQEATEFYNDVESCAVRIAAKLREMDNIDLYPGSENSAGMSNQRRFIEDQCIRAQSALPTEFYMRKLQAKEINKEIVEIDERITHNAKNWKSSLIEIGLKETDIETGTSLMFTNDKDKKAEKATKASSSKTNWTTLKKYVPKASAVISSDPVSASDLTANSPKNVLKSSFTTAAVKEEDLDMEEMDRLNEALFQRMNDAFSHDESQMAVSLLQKCRRFKDNCSRTTRGIIDRKKKEIRDTVLEKEAALRALEIQLPSLRQQNEEADLIINTKNQADKELRNIVEERYKPSMNQLNLHKSRVNEQITQINEEYAITSRQVIKIRQMIEELQIKRFHADPFLRRRAQNLVMGLLRDLSENDTRIQEEREVILGNNYKRWKETKHFIGTSEKRLAMLEHQLEVMGHEIQTHEVRIESEKMIFKEKSRELREKDGEITEKLRVLEEIISAKAREERREVYNASKVKNAQKTETSYGTGLFVVNPQTGLLESASGDSAEMSTTEVYIKALEKKYATEISQLVAGVAVKAVNSKIVARNRRVSTNPTQTAEQIAAATAAATVAIVNDGSTAGIVKAYTENIMSGGVGASSADEFDNFSESGVSIDVFNDSATASLILPTSTTPTMSSKLETLDDRVGLDSHTVKYLHEDVDSSGSEDSDGDTNSTLTTASYMQNTIHNSKTSVKNARHTIVSKPVVAKNSATRSSFNNKNINSNNNSNNTSSKQNNNTNSVSSAKPTRASFKQSAVPSNAGSTVLHPHTPGSPGSEIPQSTTPKHIDVRPLCDTATEDILDISANQAKRQEMTHTKKLAVASSPLYHTAPAAGAKSFSVNTKSSMDMASVVAGQLSSSNSSVGGNSGSNLNTGINAQNSYLSLNSANSDTTGSNSMMSAINDAVNFANNSDGHHPVSTAIHIAQSNISDNYNRVNTAERQRKHTNIAFKDMNIHTKQAPPPINVAAPKIDSPTNNGSNSSTSKAVVTPIHSIICTACYVDCFLKESGFNSSANSKRATRRLSTAHLRSFESDIEPEIHAITLSEGVAGKIRQTAVMKKFTGSNYGNTLLAKYSTYSYNVTEGVKVLENCVYLLSTSECITKDITASTLKAIEALCSAEKLCCTSEEEDEIRYKLHAVTVGVIENVMNTAPNAILVANNRKMFMETLQCLLGLIGIVLNCSLFFWEPNSNASNIGSDKVELVASQIVELILANGQLDANVSTLGKTKTAIYKRRQFGSYAFSGNSSDETADASLTESNNFIDYLRGSAEYLVRSATDSFINPAAALSQEQQQMPSFQILRAVNAQIDATMSNTQKSYSYHVDNTEKYKECNYTIAHRNAIYGVQLLLFSILNEKQFATSEVTECYTAATNAFNDRHNTTTKPLDTIIDYNSYNIIPTDFDELLLQISPQIIPAMYALELFRRVLEAEFSRVLFLQKIAESQKEVADLQHLNANLPTHVDLDIRLNKQNSAISMYNTVNSAHGTKPNSAEAGDDGRSRSNTADNSANIMTKDTEKQSKAVESRKGSQSITAARIKALQPSILAAQQRTVFPQVTTSAELITSTTIEGAEGSVIGTADNGEANGTTNDTTDFATTINSNSISNARQSILVPSKVQTLDLTAAAPPMAQRPSIRHFATSRKLSGGTMNIVATNFAAKLVNGADISGGENDPGAGSVITQNVSNNVPFAHNSENTTAGSQSVVASNVQQNAQQNISTESSVVVATPSDGMQTLDKSTANSQTSSNTAHYSTVKDVHFNWLRDIESHVVNLNRQIHTLVWNPTAIHSAVTNSMGTRRMSAAVPLIIQQQQFANQYLNPNSDHLMAQPTIPLPDLLIYKLLNYIDAVQKICAGRYDDGEARVLALQPVYNDILDELRVSRGKILRIVSALTWPMKKRLDWLRAKCAKAMEETNIVTRQIEEKRQFILRTKRDKEMYESSLLVIEREKCLALFKKTKQITLMSHSPIIQQIILDQATHENFVNLQDYKAKEALLADSIQQFKQDHDLLSLQFNRLSVAHHTISGGTVTSGFGFTSGVINDGAAFYNTAVNTSGSTYSGAMSGANSSAFSGAISGNSLSNNVTNIVPDQTNNNSNNNNNSNSSAAGINISTGIVGSGVHSAGGNINGTLDNTGTDSNRVHTPYITHPSAPVPPSSTSEQSILDSYLQVQRLSELLSSINPAANPALSELEAITEEIKIEDADDRTALAEQLSFNGMKVHVRNLRQEERERVYKNTHRDKKSSFSSPKSRNNMRASGHHMQTKPTVPLYQQQHRKPLVLINTAQEIPLTHSSANDQSPHHNVVHSLNATQHRVIQGSSSNNANVNMAQSSTEQSQQQQQHQQQHPKHYPNNNNISNNISSNLYAGGSMGETSGVQAERSMVSITDSIDSDEESASPYKHHAPLSAIPLTPKLFGFSKRIDSGLAPLSTYSINHSSSNTTENSHFQSITSDNLNNLNNKKSNIHASTAGKSGGVGEKPSRPVTSDSIFANKNLPQQYQSVDSAANSAVTRQQIENKAKNSRHLSWATSTVAAANTITGGALESGDNRQSPTSQKDPLNRSFLFYLGGMDFSTEQREEMKRRHPELAAQLSEWEDSEYNSGDELAERASPDPLLSVHGSNTLQSPNKIKIPINREALEHKSFFLEQLKRLSPFKFAELYPSSDVQSKLEHHTLTPLNLIKMMNITIPDYKPPSPLDTLAKRQKHFKTKMARSNSKDIMHFFDEFESSFGKSDLHVHGTNATQTEQQPSDQANKSRATQLEAQNQDKLFVARDTHMSQFPADLTPLPMQVIINFKPRPLKAKESLIDITGKLDHKSEEIQVEHANDGNMHLLLESHNQYKQRRDQSFYDRSVDQDTDDNDNNQADQSTLDDQLNAQQLKEIKHIEAVVDEEILSSINAIKNKGNSAFHSAIDKRKKHSLSSALRFDPNAHKPTAKKHKHFALGDAAATGVESRKQSVIESLANKNMFSSQARLSTLGPQLPVIGGWEDIDLTAVDEDESFKSHSYRFEEDVEFIRANNVKSKTIIITNKSDSDDHPLSPLMMMSSLSRNGSINRGYPHRNSSNSGSGDSGTINNSNSNSGNSKSGDTSNPLNKQIKELLKSEVVVVTTHNNNNAIVSGNLSGFQDLKALGGGYGGIVDRNHYGSSSVNVSANGSSVSSSVSGSVSGSASGSFVILDRNAAQNREMFNSQQSSNNQSQNLSPSLTHSPLTIHHKQVKYATESPARVLPVVPSQPAQEKTSVPFASPRKVTFSVVTK